jgi:hypothetical protein
MIKYRSATLALAAGAATLAVAACSAGTQSASSTGSSSSASPSSPAGTSSAAPVTSVPAPTTGAPIPGRTLTVTGKLGSFPVPKAAKIGEKISGGSSLILVFGSVAPADVARFYGTALPQAGYTVTSNSLVTQGSQHGAVVLFSGHGYKGDIEAVDQFPGAAIAGLGDTNVTTVTVSATS